MKQQEVWLDLGDLDVGTVAAVQKQANAWGGDSLRFAIDDRRDIRALDASTVALSASLISATCAMIGLGIKVFELRKAKKDSSSTLSGAMQDQLKLLRSELPQNVTGALERSLTQMKVNPEATEISLVLESQYEMRVSVEEVLFVKGRAISR